MEKPYPTKKNLHGRLLENLGERTVPSYKLDDFARCKSR